MPVYDKILYYVISDDFLGSGHSGRSAPEADSDTFQVKTRTRTHVTPYFMTYISIL